MKWEVMQEELCFQGFYRLKRYQVRHALFEGGMGAPIRRELLLRGNAAGVLPYDPVRDAVVLVEQFRIGAMNSPHGPWLTEIVAGLMEPGEQPEDVVRREAVEEAGCQLRELEHISTYYSSPGGSDERVSLFVGCVDSEGMGGIHGLAEEGENIRVSVRAAEEAFAQMAGGLIDNAMTIIALQWLQLHRERLRGLWR
ncbi:NUDIX domain-containing protein [Acidihalobacter ferrooxydans]|uniref:ADP-ribose pyrophosphatase n=1 Tax=Acidihalobacter ferrooxydans TaxID=1765967 RepID=A0A1P8UGX6_9GAMM|nr:NUDIX domain-containing protein [Acidihalobacter ferrooxydans]APZ43079.1 ADP-ribose diphosphatase [Acidihalobacter ferrooxydans]